MDDLVIRTSDLTCTFGTLDAVNRVSMEVRRGTIFGFLGPNGAGKTTMIRLLLGLLEPSRGSAEVLGFDVRRRGDDVRAACGVLSEHSGLYERLSAEDNLEFYARVWRLPRAERRDRIQELLTHLGLWDRRRERVEKWSRGMKQKLAIARALLHRPSLVFLDEPTAGLDPSAAARLREDLAALVTQEDATVFLTTHNLAEAERLCGSVGVIRNGQLLAVGSPDELRASKSAPRMEVTGRKLDSDELLAALRARPEVASLALDNHRLVVELSGPVDTAPLVALMVDKGVEVDEVHKGTASLEDVFLTLMEEEK
jgi:ABC-2 type transport system ATP-binding protein